MLSRLTYGVYLTHWAFQVASVAKTRAPFHLDVYNLVRLTSHSSPLVTCMCGLSSNLLRLAHRSTSPWEI